MDNISMLYASLVEEATAELQSPSTAIGTNSCQRPPVGSYAVLTRVGLDFLVCCVTGCLPVDMDSGEVAKWVSNASFATLTLIYSFTQLLDLAKQFSTLMGVTLRVGQLLQVLPAKLLVAGLLAP